MVNDIQHDSTTKVRPQNGKSDKMLFTNFLPDISCGGRTRTCDLQVMSLASYQLLHTAI